MNKKIIIFILSAMIGSTLAAAVQSPIAVRAAIDIGTGGPKLRVGEVNLETGKIVRILHTEQFFVNFHGSLAKSSMFSEDVKARGHEAFQKAITKAKTFNPEGIIAVATAAFRDATNGLEFAQEIQEKNGIKVHVIDQKLEGELPFLAVLAKTNAKSEELLIWDIGGRSTQLVRAGADGFCHVEGRNEGSGLFKDYIIEKIQGRSIQECNSPNPLSAQDVNQAKAYARSLAEKVDQAFKIQQLARTVVGVGPVFGNGIAKSVGKTTFTREELSAVVQEMINKNDEELSGDDFACVEASNAILALGFMEGLQIEEMQVIHVNNADGALIYQPFWR
jgi:exopolyphosphatase / guanosine-5'-triphosphate,3'-diphosphate pyrophosphatase